MLKCLTRTMESRFQKLRSNDQFREFAAYRSDTNICDTTRNNQKNSRWFLNFTWMASCALSFQWCYRNTKLNFSQNIVKCHYHLSSCSKITCPELVPEYSRWQCDILMDGHLRNVDNIKSGKWCQSAHPCEITELALHLLPENSYCNNPDRQGISLIDCPAMNPWGYFTHYSGGLIWDHEPTPKVEHAAPYDVSSTGIASFCQKTIMISLDFTLHTLNLLYEKKKSIRGLPVSVLFALKWPGALSLLSPWCIPQGWPFYWHSQVCTFRII